MPALSQDTFPAVIKAIEAHSDQDTFSVTDLFGPGDGGTAQLNQLLSYVTALPTAGLPLTPCESRALPDPAVSGVEQQVGTRVSTCGVGTAHAPLHADECGHILTTRRNNPSQAKAMSAASVADLDLEDVAPQELLLPLRLPLRGDAAASTGEALVTHRVVNIRASGAVPLGLRGTVVATHEDKAEVVFDEPFLAASNLNGRLSQFRGFTVPRWSLLSLTARSLVVSRPAALAAVGKAKKKKTKAVQPKKGNAAAGGTLNPYAALLDA